MDDPPRLVATSPGETPEDTRIRLIRAARIISAEHWPLGGVCAICRTPDCEPSLRAATYLDLVGDDYLPEVLPSAQILIRAAQLGAENPAQVRAETMRLLAELDPAGEE